MSYPEKTAGYRHMPKFMDRALAAERRADGGSVPTDPDSDQYDPGRSGPAYTPGSQGALLEAMQYSRTAQSLDQPNKNRGQGPTRRRAADPTEGD